MKPQCIHCTSKEHTSDERSNVVCFGFFTRQSDQERLQRFLCKTCGKSFSAATQSQCYQQKKRHFNKYVFELLVSGVSQRRAARLLKINRKTVVRKFIFLGTFAELLLPHLNTYHPKARIIEFDDLETFEHSKCKPLSVTLAVEYKTRRILGFRVSRMPAKGLLVALARKKYGFRRDERKPAREALFKEIKDYVEIGAVIKSDENPHYRPDVAKHFPLSKHKAFKGRRGCIVGQGELKRGGFDPLYSLNHTCAMLRANINRLFRRTWNTTKVPQRLSYHIAMYALYHNLVLI